jgi:streptomycin 3"-adenylyltransferase
MSAHHGVVPSAPLRYAEQVTKTVASRCGHRLAASYLHGSAVLGGWVAERSDVDILFVVAADITQADAIALGEVLVAAGADCPGRGLETSVVTTSQAARPAEPWPFVVHCGPGATGQRLVDGGERPGDDDLIMHYAVCRAAGVAVSGPAPERMIGPIPRAVILGYLAGELDWGLAHAPESYAVLNACRALEYLTRGRIVSKVAGGEAMRSGESDPSVAAPAGLVERALEQQRAHSPEQPPGADAIAFVRAIGARLRSGR